MSGLIILPVFIIYFSISFTIVYMIFKEIFPKVSTIKLKLIVSLIVFFLPYLDLFLQKGIQLYYAQTDFTKAVAYHYPFDENGKLESCDLIGFSNIGEKKLSDKEFYDYENILVDNFVELKLNNEKLARLDLKNYTFEYINQAMAKYRLEELKDSNRCFGLCAIHTTQLMDTQTNTVMGEVKYMNFESKYAYFREEVLFQITGTGYALFRVHGVYTLASTDRLIKALREYK